MRSKDSAFDITALDLSELAGFFNLSTLGISPKSRQHFKNDICGKMI